jgi:hypothetical protein
LKATEKDNPSVRYTWDISPDHINRFQPASAAHFRYGVWRSMQSIPSTLDGERIAQATLASSQWRGSIRSDFSGLNGNKILARLGRSRLSAAGVCRLLRQGRTSQSSGFSATNGTEYTNLATKSGKLHPEHIPLRRYLTWWKNHTP